VLGTTYQHLASVQQQSDPAAAMATAEKLVGLRQKQSEGAAGDEVRADLAVAYDSRSSAADVLGRREQSLRDGLFAVSIWEELLAKSPANATWQRNAALGHKYTAGRLLALGQDLALAELHLRRAEDLDEGLVRARPLDRGARMDLSFDLSQDGFLQWRRFNNPARARDLYGKALAIREELAQSDPSDARLKDRISYLRYQIGLLELESGNPAAALTHASVAERIDRDFYMHENSPSNRRRLADAVQLSARANGAAGHPQAACEDWERCRQLVIQDVRAGTANSEEREWLAEATSRLQACGNPPKNSK